MEIPIVGAEEFAKTSRCGATKRQRYGIWIDAIQPEVLPWVKENLAIPEAAPGGILSVKAIDIAKALGPRFEDKSETTIYWNLRFAFYLDGIFVSSTGHAQINPKTNEPYMVLQFRWAKPGDKLSADQTAYLEQYEKGGTVDDPNAKVCKPT